MLSFAVRRILEEFYGELCDLMSSRGIFIVWQRGNNCGSVEILFISVEFFFAVTIKAIVGIWVLAG